MTKLDRKWYLPILILLLVGTILIIRRNAAHNSYNTAQGFIFGTTYKITFQGDTALAHKCLSAMNDVDAALSMFNSQSNLSQINTNSTNIMRPMTQEVLQLAYEVSKATGGAFDVTVAPLVNAWGFGFKNDALPDSACVDSLMSHIGFGKIVLNDSVITKLDTCVMLDCSAIAKGYACDVVARTLEDNAVQNYMVEIGGEVVTHGVNSKGKPWRVGVSRPSEETVQQEVVKVLELNSRAMATSGNYRNFYVTEEGRKISHTINPATGYPVRHSLLSATVFAPTCARADAFATAFMVMGKDKAIEVLSQNTDLNAILIYEEDGEMKIYEQSF